jgi:RimJ/RimL family protein N-acetyltransferase
MRYIDVAENWRKEREAGDVRFGIWTPARKKAGSERTDQRFIGTCGLHSHREIYRSWELRILIFDPDAIGKGIGLEATTLLAHYGFQRLNAHRIWLGCSADNEPAWKTYEKVGFKREGVLRDDLFYDGKYHDAYRYAILEHDEARGRLGA